MGKLGWILLGLGLGLGVTSIFRPVVTEPRQVVPPQTSPEPTDHMEAKGDEAAPAPDEAAPAPDERPSIVELGEPESGRAVDVFVRKGTRPAAGIRVALWVNTGPNGNVLPLPRRVGHAWTDRSGWARFRGAPIGHTQAQVEDGAYVGMPDERANWTWDALFASEFDPKHLGRYFAPAYSPTPPLVPKSTHRLALHPSHTVSARVLFRSDGSPATGVQVWWVTEESGPHPVATTNAQGRFSLQVPRGKCGLILRSETSVLSFLECEDTASWHRDNKRGLGPLYVDRGFQLKGRLTYPNGALLRGGSIRVSNLGEYSSWRDELPHIEGGFYGIRFRDETGPGILPYKWTSWSGESATRARCDDSGRFSLTGLPLNTALAVEARRSPEHGWAFVGPLVHAGSESVIEKEFRVPRSANLKVTVKRRKGVPTPTEAIVTVAYPGGARIKKALDGRMAEFRDLAPGPVIVWVRSENNLIEVKRGDLLPGRIMSWNLASRRIPKAVNVRVLGPDGSPVSGAKVEFQPFDRVKTDQTSRPQRSRIAGPEGRLARTDDSGNARIARLWEGEYVITASSKDERLRSIPRRVTVTGGETIECQLEEPSRVQFEFVDRSGAEVSMPKWFRLSYDADEFTVRHFYSLKSTDADLLAGRYTVHRPNDFVQASFAVDRELHSPPQTIRLETTAGGPHDRSTRHSKMLHLRVRDNRGRVPVGLEVRTLDGNEHGEALPVEGRVIMSANAYSYDADPMDSMHRARVEATGYVRTNIELLSDRGAVHHVTVQLERTYPVRIRVLQSDSGKPSWEHAVFCDQREHKELRGLTLQHSHLRDQGGQISPDTWLLMLPAGTWQALLYEPGIDYWKSEASILGTIEITEDGPREFAFKYPKQPEKEK